MKQEYVTVQAPQGGRAKRRLSRARLRRVVALAIAAGATLFAGLGIIDEWTSPTPEPVTLPSVPPPDAARTTAEVYQEWLSRSEMVACLNARGDAYEPRIVDREHTLETATQYLGVEPATAHPEAPLPMLRQPGLYAGIDADTLGGGTPCALASPTFDVMAPGDVQAFVDAARADKDFLATVAEQVWVQRHPAQVTHLVALAGDRADAVAEPSDAWSERHGLVYAAVQEQIVWVPVVAGQREEFAQSVGLVSSGGAVVIRTGEGQSILDGGVHGLTTDAIRCGPISMSAGVREPWGTAEDLAEVVRAMGASCNALIGAGFVEAETLHDVYWD